MELRVRPIHVLLIIACLLTSCARMCGQMAYQNAVDAQTRRHIYDGQSADEIWTETSALLIEYGYSAPDIAAAPVQQSYLTEWRGEPGARDRLSVRIISNNRRSHRLQIHEIREYEETIYPRGYDPYDPNAKPLDPAQIKYETRTSRGRHLQYEWEVLQRLDPEAALLIEGEAMRRRDMTQEVVANGCQ